jgi:hypothetical protein
MANRNFVVHNGLTVGDVDIFAGNSQVKIGTIILKEEGNALKVRNFDDTADAVITGTFTTTSTTSGNLQIGLNHIEAVNTNGNIDLRPNGTGQVLVSSGAGLNVTGNVVIGGNLTVNGTTTTINSTTLTVDDLNIVLASGAATAAAANGAGISVDGASTFFRYESTPNSWVIDRSFIPNANATLSLGATGSRWANIWGLASSAQYADLAERYDAGIYIEPGTVVEFGGDNEVQVCDTLMSTKVAGIVSTAPGYLMNDTADKDATWIAVALQGRVPTRVVGPVTKGDMMVSAGNGYAMSCAAPVIGSVIGKALENFSEGQGVIEVVVGRV